jgi:DNA primase
MITIWKTPIVATVEQVVTDLKLQVYGAGLLREINNTGSDIMTNCPFHKGGKERKPSFGISLHEKKVKDRTYEAGTCHCYTCGYTAELPQFVSDLLGIGTKVDGYRWLVGRYNYSATEREPLELDIYRGESTKSSYMADEDIKIFHSQLLTSQRAMDYLRGRKIIREVVEIYNCGYDPADDVVLFPVYDLLGRVPFYKSRSVAGKHFYNAKDVDKTSVIFGLYQIVQAKLHPDTEIWIVESEIDALSLISQGEPAIALMGSHIAEDQIKELERTPYRKFLIATDNDDAGRKGANQIKDLLIPRGFRFFNLEWLTDLKDVNDLIKNFGDEFRDHLNRY